MIGNPKLSANQSFKTKKKSYLCSQTWFDQHRVVLEEVLAGTKVSRDRGTGRHQDPTRQRYWQAPRSHETEVLAGTRIPRDRGTGRHQDPTKQRYWQGPRSDEKEVLAGTKIPRDRGTSRDQDPTRQRERRSPRRLSVATRMRLHSDRQRFEPFCFVVISGTTNIRKKMFLKNLTQTQRGENK